MAEELSHVKQLSLIHVCKIGLKKPDTLQELDHMVLYTPGTVKVFSDYICTQESIFGYCLENNFRIRISHSFWPIQRWHSLFNYKYIFTQGFYKKRVFEKQGGAQAYDGKSLQGKLLQSGIG